LIGCLEARDDRLTLTCMGGLKWKLNSGTTAHLTHDLPLSKGQGTSNGSSFASSRPYLSLAQYAKV
jgi:hypothetical protein